MRKKDITLTFCVGTWYSVSNTIVSLPAWCITVRLFKCCSESPRRVKSRYFFLLVQKLLFCSPTPGQELWKQNNCFFILLKSILSWEFVTLKNKHFSSEICTPPLFLVSIKYSWHCGSPTKTYFICPHGVAVIQYAGWPQLQRWMFIRLSQSW